MDLDTTENADSTPDPSGPIRLTGLPFDERDPEAEFVKCTWEGQVQTLIYKWKGRLYGEQRVWSKQVESPLLTHLKHDIRAAVPDLNLTDAQIDAAIWAIQFFGRRQFPNPKSLAVARQGLNLKNRVAKALNSTDPKHIESVLRLDFRSIGCGLLKLADYRPGRTLEDEIVALEARYPEGTGPDLLVELPFKLGDPGFEVVSNQWDGMTQTLIYKWQGTLHTAQRVWSERLDGPELDRINQRIRDAVPELNLTEAQLRHIVSAIRAFGGELDANRPSFVFARQGLRLKSGIARALNTTDPEQIKKVLAVDFSPFNWLKLRACFENAFMPNWPIV